LISGAAVQHGLRDAGKIAAAILGNGEF